MSNNWEIIKLGLIIEKIYEHLKLYAKFGVPVHNFHQLHKVSYVLMTVRITKYDFEHLRTVSNTAMKSFQII